MNLEIFNNLLEANGEMPTKDDILRRFRSDFAARLAARLDGNVAPLPDFDEDLSRAPRGSFGGPAALGFRTVEDPAPGHDEAQVPEKTSESFSAPEPMPEPTPEPTWEPMPEPTPEPTREPSPEPVREITADQAAGTDAAPVDASRDNPLAELFGEALKEESAQIAEVAACLPTVTAAEPAAGESPADDGRKGKKKKKR